MTRRIHFFPRLDVRESPPPVRVRSQSTHAQDWIAAVARGRQVKAHPSQYQGIARTVRSAGLDEVVSERRRKGEVFEP